MLIGINRSKYKDVDMTKPIILRQKINEVTGKIIRRIENGIQRSADCFVEIYEIARKSSSHLYHRKISCSHLPVWEALKLLLCH